MPRRASASKPNRWLKPVLWTAGILIVLVVVALLLAPVFLNRYLRSPEFRTKLADRTSHNLRAQVEIDPIRFEGTQFFVDKFNAIGTPEAGFSNLKVDSLRGDISLPSVVRMLFGERRFKITNAEVELLSLNFFDNEKKPFELPPPEERMKGPGELEKLTIREVRVGWPAGGVTGVRVVATPVDGGWALNGDGGKVAWFAQTVDLVNARVVVKEPIVYVQESKFRIGDGEMAVTGEVNWERQADVLGIFKEIKVLPLLPEDWRARLHGELAGELRMVLPMGTTPGHSTVTGKLQLNKGVLEGLPVMNKIADYLKTEQFRKTDLQVAQCDLRNDEKGLRVSNFVVESKQLFAIRGGFTYANGLVDGLFDVGIAPSRLQYLPGAEARVFVAQNDGYAWAKMRVTGPPDNLKEDLSSRLVDAAVGAVTEKVEKTATEAVETVGSAVDSAKKVGEGVFNKLFGN
jgi:hypothetical protein